MVAEKYILNQRQQMGIIRGSAVDFNNDSWDGDSKENYDWPREVTDEVWKATRSAWDCELFLSPHDHCETGCFEKYGLHAPNASNWDVEGVERWTDDEPADDSDFQT
jgi:hypothetical protein